MRKLNLKNTLVTAAACVMAACITVATPFAVSESVERERAYIVTIDPSPAQEAAPRNTTTVPLAVITLPPVPTHTAAPTPIPTPMPTPTPKPTPTPEPWAHPLTDDEYAAACAIVMGEAGGEPYDGQLAVAQCIRNGCALEGVTPSELYVLYQYDGYEPIYSESVERAVTAVFRDGDSVTDTPILYFYAPKICGYSKWHESKKYVLTIGGHKFFTIN